MTPEAVLDASAVLALLNAEPGSERVVEILPNAVISWANYCEVVSKLDDVGVPTESIREALATLGLRVEPMDEDQAWSAGTLRSATKSRGLPWNPSNPTSELANLG